MRYFHRDQLGSVSVVTDESGAVIERLAYEPFGKRRYPNGAFDPSGSLVGVNTDRGFTGHEHLDEVQLIHMNGRVYDPLLGRFMSADPIVQSPSNLQSYNRYSYVANNPLAYTDPTGYSSWKRKLALKQMALGVPADLAFFDAYVAKPRQDAWLLKHPNSMPYVKVVVDAIICYYGGPFCAVGSAAFNAQFDQHMCERSGGSYSECHRLGVKSFAATYLTATVAAEMETASWYNKVGANATAAGLAAGIQGGDPRKAMFYSLGYAALFYAYRAVAGDTPMANQDKQEDVVGGMLRRVDEGVDLTATCVEGGHCSRFFANIPFVKAIGWVHDWITGTSPVGYPSVSIDGLGRVIPRLPSSYVLNALTNGWFVTDLVINYGTMLPAAAWTIGAMAYEVGVVPHAR
jgi:RHS repeat-associated protein